MNVNYQNIDKLSVVLSELIDNSLKIKDKIIKESCEKNLNEVNIFKKWLLIFEKAYSLNQVMPFNIESENKTNIEKIKQLEKILLKKEDAIKFLKTKLIIKTVT